jgi:hypothetical protein
MPCVMTTIYKSKFLIISNSEQFHYFKKWDSKIYITNINQIKDLMPFV